MATDFDVSIVIPTLRAGDDLISCLESIAGDTDSPASQVIVILNNPNIETLDLKEHHPDVRVVPMGSNVGFAAACNRGALEAIGKTLVFINDDMVVRPGWLSSLVKPVAEGEFTTSGGRILSEDGKKIDFDGGSINILGWGFQANHGEPSSAIDDDFTMTRKLPFACGGNFAIDAGTYEKYGGFDGDYFAFYEDVDLGWRLRLAGHEITYASDAVVHHNAGATGSMMPEGTKWFLQERNALQTVIKNLSDELLNKVLPIAFALVGVRATILSGLNGTDIIPDTTWREPILGPDDTAPEARGLFKGIVDGVRETLKAGMKQSRKGSLADGYLPIETRGAAGLLAMEWILHNWDSLMSKRAKVQDMRVREDREILSVFDDPVRPVLGHPREVDAMKPLESILNELMR
jgi:GT2 family glycosyltransferase